MDAAEKGRTDAFELERNAKSVNQWKSPDIIQLILLINICNAECEYLLRDCGSNLNTVAGVAACDLLQSTEIHNLVQR